MFESGFTHAWVYAPTHALHNIFYNPLPQSWQVTTGKTKGNTYKENTELKFRIFNWYLRKGQETKFVSIFLSFIIQAHRTDHQSMTLKSPSKETKEESEEITPDLATATCSTPELQ